MFPINQGYFFDSLLGRLVLLVDRSTLRDEFLRALKIFTFIDSHRDCFLIFLFLPEHRSIAQGNDLDTFSRFNWNHVLNVDVNRDPVSLGRLVHTHAHALRKVLAGGLQVVGNGVLDRVSHLLPGGLDRILEVPEIDGFGIDLQILVGELRDEFGLIDNYFMILFFTGDIAALPFFCS
jgi:hypothetical protein